MDVISFIFKSGKFDEFFNKPIINLPDLFKFKPATLQTIHGDTPALEVLTNNIIIIIEY